jgi:hypothetical protein
MISICAHVLVTIPRRSLLHRSSTAGGSAMSCRAIKDLPPHGPRFDLIPRLQKLLSWVPDAAFPRADSHHNHLFHLLYAGLSTSNNLWAVEFGQFWQSKLVWKQ